MGGIPPLGYDVQDRKLLVNRAEANRVQFIYKCYLKLGSVPDLVADLKKRGIRGKSWKTQKGSQRKGGFFARGALYRLLRNPVYLGSTIHKGKRYLRTHEAIVSRELWEKVQTLLSAQGGKQNGPCSTKNLLSGSLFDDLGNPMQHSHATKSGGRRYRYYVSRPLLNRNPGTPGSIPRIPAQTIEDLLWDRVQNLLPTDMRKGWNQMPLDEQKMHIQRAIQRVELRAEEVEISLSEGLLDPKALRKHQASMRGELIFEKGSSLILRIPIRLKTWGGEKLIHAPMGELTGGCGLPDKTLIKAVARAIEWREALEKGKSKSLSDLARKEGCTDDYIRKILKLAFLAPEIIEAILEGKQPRGVTLSHILRVDLPLSWKLQRQTLGFPPGFLT
jgi:hypothetical protein